MVLLLTPPAEEALPYPSHLVKLNDETVENHRVFFRMLSNE